MSGGLKQSLYFPEDMLEEIEKEARRQDRSVSWIVQQAWKIGRRSLRELPSANDMLQGRTRMSGPPSSDGSSSL